MTNYSILLHGGAGAKAGFDYSETEQHLSVLAAQAERQVQGGRSALDVVESAVNAMEASGLYVAGRGSAENDAGYVELDAAIMDGTDSRAGSVACLTGAVYPVSVARGVMEKTRHVMLAGNGADHFAREYGYEVVESPGDYYRLPVGVSREDTQTPDHGTVGAVALDSHGRLAAATSTGGTFAKREGRVGDSPLIGIGTWADEHLAISCTGTGEQIIRAGGAMAIAAAVRHGARLKDAVDIMLARVAELGGDGGVIAVSASGEQYAAFNSDGMKRASVADGEAITSTTF